MRNLVAMIAAVLSAMPKMVLRKVLEAGQWVERLFMEPAAPMQTEPVMTPTAEPAVEDYSAIQRLAKSMLAGSDPADADLLATPDLTINWLASLDRIELAKVALADLATLRGHIRGGQPMRGIVPHDTQAIDDVMRARRSPEAVEQRERTRERIAEFAGAPMPA